MSPISSVVVLAATPLSRRVERVWKDFDLRPVVSDADVEALVGALLDEGVEDLVIDGDDRFLGRFVSAYLEDVEHRSRPIRVIAVGGHELGTIARATTGGFGRDEIAALLRPDLGLDWHPLSIPALKISASSKPQAHYGFSFAAGWWYSAFETYHRSGRADGASLPKTLATLGRDVLAGQDEERSDEVRRLTLDYRPLGDSWGHLLATTLSETWLGIEGAQRPVPMARMGHDTSELVKGVLRDRWTPRMLRQERGGLTFDRLHLDGSRGYVVDGELYGGSAPQIIEVSQGPRMYFSRPARGVLSKVKDLFSGTFRRD